LLTLIQTGMSGLQFALIPLLPLIKRDLAVGVTRTTILASAVSAGTLLAALPAGQIMGRIGERRAVVLGAVLAGAALMAAALVPDAWLMLPPLVLAGTGVVFSHPAGVRLILRRFGVRERGGALSIRQTAIPIGGVLAALALPPLAELAGWRVSLIAVGLVALALAVVARLALPDDTPAAGSAPDRPPPLASVLRNGGVLLSAALGFSLNVGQVATTTFLALYAHEALGHSVGAGALLLAAVQASGIAGRILWGIVSDRLYHGRRRPLLFGLSLASILVVAALALAQTGTPLPVLVALAVLAGLTVVSWNGLVIALLTQASGLAGAGTAMSLMVMVVGFVNTAVPLLGGVLVDLTGSYRAVWLAATAVLLASPPLIVLARERSDGYDAT
jgi:predicted MFS family arabinose efflux permease